MARLSGELDGPADLRAERGRTVAREVVMEEVVRNPFTAWETFYVIVGSVAGALTGLQFVVMALIAESETRATSPEVATFGTPTVIHFCASLLIAALLTAPWGTPAQLAFPLGACGLAGVGYSFVVFRRARAQTRYQPELEDWIWHTILPPVAYGLLIVAAVWLYRGSGPALALIGAVSLGLVFIGIHNAWDTITYVAVDLRQPGATARQRGNRG